MEAAVRALCLDSTVRIQPENELTSPTSESCVLGGRVKKDLMKDVLSRQHIACH